MTRNSNIYLSFGRKEKSKRSQALWPVFFSGLAHAVPLTLIGLSTSFSEHLPPEPMAVTVEWLPETALHTPMKKASLQKIEKGLPSSNATPPTSMPQPRDPPSCEDNPVPQSLSTAINHKPIYPENARIMGIEGTVLVNVEISTAGTVLSTKILEPKTHKILEKSAVSQLRKWRFDKQITPYTITIPIKFELT